MRRHQERESTIAVVVPHRRAAGARPDARRAGPPTPSPSLSLSRPRLHRRLGDRARFRYTTAVTFLRRLLSSDYRRAVAAEAAGDLDLAAECFGLAGDRDSAVRIHLQRAARAGTRTLEIAALRDALHWAGEDAGLRRRPSAALGQALLAAIEAEGIATQRDRERVREAAELLIAGGEHQRAGEALTQIGEHMAAASAFSSGGLVELMEAALAKDDDGQQRAHAEQDAFASYQTHLALGRRDEARADLQRCIGHAASSAEYRRLLDTLESRLITGGRVELLVRGRSPLIVCAVKRVLLGRDPLCDLALRSGGVSRQHAEIEVQGAPPRYLLHDLGSRNGTTLAGLPVAGRLPLVGAGSFGLGDECTVHFDFAQPPSDGAKAELGSGADAGASGELDAADRGPGASSDPPAAGQVLRLRVHAGLDRGAQLLAGPEGIAIDLTPAELGVSIVFRDGRPFLAATSARQLRFGGEPLGAVAVQLIRGDQLRIDGTDVDVA
jgi:tetratricopeptide (TPR) repeat protein